MVGGIMFISSSFISSCSLFSSPYLFPLVPNYSLIFRSFISRSCHVYRTPLIHSATLPRVRFTNTVTESVWTAEVAHIWYLAVRTAAHIGTSLCGQQHTFGTSLCGQQRTFGTSLCGQQRTFAVPTLAPLLHYNRADGHRVQQK